VEDTEGTIGEVCEHFGERVAALVAEVAHDEGLDSAERNRSEVERIASRSHPAKLIKLADKISNGRDSPTIRRNGMHRAWRLIASSPQHSGQGAAASMTISTGSRKK